MLAQLRSDSNAAGGQIPREKVPQVPSGLEYNRDGTEKMARGWESKSVEAQIESAESRSPKATGDGLTAAQITQVRERENILLSRTRVLRELETSKNPR